MALADITLNDGQGTPVSHTFAYIATSNGRVVRSDMSAGAETPLLLTLAHSQVVRKGVQISSHLWRIDTTVLDADGITPYTGNIRVACDIPDKIRSDALADDFAAYVRNYFSSANMRLLFKNSVG